MLRLKGMMSTCTYVECEVDWDCRMLACCFELFSLKDLQTPDAADKNLLHITVIVICMLTAGVYKLDFVCSFAHPHSTMSCSLHTVMHKCWEELFLKLKVVSKLKIQSTASSHQASGIHGKEPSCVTIGWAQSLLQSSVQHVCSQNIEGPNINTH